MYLLLSVLFVVAGSPDGVMPPRPPLVSRWTGEPIFIPAVDLVDESGKYAAGVPKAWQELIESLAHHSPGRREKTGHSEVSPCAEEMHEMDVEHLVSRRDAEETITNAVAIFYGRVGAVTPGLFYASPGSLLELRDVQVIRRGPYNRVADTLYVRHPYARFSIRKTEYCRLAADDMVRPQLGDEVIVFAFEQAVDQSGIFIHSLHEDLILAGGDRLQIPPVFQALARRDKTFASIRSTVLRRALARDRAVK